jgi:hypothetical protein
MKNQKPFLDVSSFTIEEESRDILESDTSNPSSSPFLSVYESEETGGLIDPEIEEYVAFLNELFDEEFDEALAVLIDEASAIYETQFHHEQEDFERNGYQAERLLDQYFAPLVFEAESMLGALATELNKSDPKIITEKEIEEIIDMYQYKNELTPSFEEFLGKLKKTVKKVSKKGVDLAKRGIGAAARLGLEKLKVLIQPMLKRVIQTAIGKLPSHLQPIARKLAERMPFLKELEDSYEPVIEAAETCEVAEIQYEFDQEIANILFARTEVEQELEIAKALTKQQIHINHPLAELDLARDHAAKIMTNLIRCAYLAADGIAGKTGERIRKMIGIANRLGYPKNLQLWYYNPKLMWEYFNWRTDNKRRAVMTSGTRGKMPFDGYAHPEQWRNYPFQDMASRYGVADMTSCTPEIKNYLIVMHDQIETSFTNIQQQMDIAQSGVHKGAPEMFLKHLHDLRASPDHLYSAFK